MVNWRLILSCFLVAVLSFAVLVVDIHAQNLEYQAENYEAAIIPTIDGVWTTPDEWSD